MPGLPARSASCQDAAGAPSKLLLKLPFSNTFAVCSVFGGRWLCPVAVLEARPTAMLSARYPLVLLCCSCCTGALTMFDLVLLIVCSIFVLLQDRRGVCAPRAGDSCRSSAAGALDGVSQTTVYDTCWQGPRLDGGRLSVAGPAARRAAGRCRRRRPRLPRLRVRRPRRPPGTRQLRARAPERAFTTPADRRQRSLGSAGCSAAAAGGARAGAGAGRSGLARLGRAGPCGSRPCAR